mgnify:CR=1 FL=1
MEITLTVNLWRGLNLRKTPKIEDGNIVGTLSYNMRFYAVGFKREKGESLLWARDKDGFWIVAANGRNMYVKPMNGKPLPLG